MPPVDTHHSIGDMATRPPVNAPVEYGNAASWWVEYPTGLVDLSRSKHLDDSASIPPSLTPGQLEIPVNGGRTIRVDTKATALVIIDMQNFFLHPDMRAHPKGLACVDPTLAVLPGLRAQGVKILWVNWGLTDNELQTIPPALVRGFQKSGAGGFGAELRGGWGRLLVRDAKNSALYGSLQTEYEKGREAGTDFWIHKNRMSGLWGYQSALDLFLKENGIKTLLFGGVNADQCVLGTFIDAYYRGYDCIMVEDATATTSPEGGYENVIYNSGNAYGFVTDSARIAAAASAH
ncbi:Isochorismatase hydrolase [Pluteus cervinus]|uniref:Isochorismatase hydrolase n=1 Tax=Pluteus cervinus TaxID=181527 RepID=A0ACD3BHL0_9AGAR|nr:Isochorismatase hydrolase [Pluteus cervinus]